MRSQCPIYPTGPDLQPRKTLAFLTATVGGSYRIHHVRRISDSILYNDMMIQAMSYRYNII